MDKQYCVIFLSLPAGIFCKRLDFPLCAIIVLSSISLGRVFQFHWTNVQ